jgi:hypothetical protein
MTGPRLYHFFFLVTGKNVKRDAEAELLGILRTLDAKGAAFKGNPIIVEAVDGAKFEGRSAESKLAGEKAKGDLVSYAPFEIPEDVLKYFKGLFGLDSHIRRLLRAVGVARDTEFTKRINTVLIGPPGCGKTELCRHLKLAVGSDAVMELDATATTKAGAQKMIDDAVEAGELPRALIVEEIEKADSETLSFLLGLGDSRAEIRKTTARGNIHREAKMVIIATCNNYERFCSLNYGALKSRFANEIWFQRPSDKILTDILMREIDDVAGDGSEGSGAAKYKWITPTLAWCHEVDNLDPRYVITICLTGQDALLTDEYQTDLRATMQPSNIIEDFVG